MLRVITFNANGIRAAARKGFFEWLARQRADVVCVQETRAREEQLDARHFYPTGYQCWYYEAQTPGYSGTALYSRVAPKQLSRGMGWDPMDSEARCLRADYSQLSILSLYLPSGSSGPEKQEKKFFVMNRLYEEFKVIIESGLECILCADWNICHRPIDLKNWRANQGNSGFLPEERAWMGSLLEEQGWVDSFRALHPELAAYTWWSNRGRARENNIGWRLDYQLVTPQLARAVRGAEICRSPQFSDHAPLIMDYDVSLS